MAEAEAPAFEGNFSGSVQSSTDLRRRYHYAGHYLLGDDVAAFMASVSDVNGKLLGEVSGLLRLDGDHNSGSVAERVRNAAEDAIRSGTFRGVTS